MHVSQQCEKELQNNRSYPQSRQTRERPDIYGAQTWACGSATVQTRLKEFSKRYVTEFWSLRNKEGKLGLKMTQLLCFNPSRGCRSLTNTSWTSVMASLFGVWHQTQTLLRLSHCEDWKMGFSYQYLIEEVFKHKVVVVVTGGELHVLQKEPQLNVQWVFRLCCVISENNPREL